MPDSDLPLSFFRDLIVSDAPPILLSVDTEPVFKCGHLSGSLRNAVYEMGFVGRMDGLGTDKDADLVVYSAADDSHAPAFAAEKLKRAGFSRVQVLRGGIDAWRTAGLPIEVEAEPPETHDYPDGRLTLDRENSILRWTGRNLANLHHGSIGLKSGWVELKEGKLVDGDLVIDMEAIDCDDISDAEVAGILIAHLRDHDFFDVEKHLAATVSLTEIQFEGNQSPGRPNYHGTAELNLRGVSHPLRFSLIGGSASPDGFSLQGPVSFDRTQWGVLYGSARFFAGLGMHLVNDLIDLDLRLNFKR